MSVIGLRVPIYVPLWLHQKIRRWRRAILGNGEINLRGDRDVEWSFIAAHMPEGPGEALDFGSGGSPLSLLVALRGFHVTALDLEEHRPYWQHSNATLKQADLFASDFPHASFDLIINCSAVEHVGLVGRYSVHEARENGDLEAMAWLRKILKPGCRMLLTVPVARDAVFAPLCRVYGVERLPQLLQGFAVEHEEYWVKNPENRWVEQTRAIAIDFQASAGSWDSKKNKYALGCFVLRRPD